MSGRTTVLIVDDEEAVLGLAQVVLQDEGYQALVARDGMTALALADGHDGPIEVALIDVILPGMSGPVLAERLRECRPETKFLFTSGYGSGAGVALHRREPESTYLKKPFSPDQLAAAVAGLIG